MPCRPDPELALAICLALLDPEPAVYPRAGARWERRFALGRNLPLIDAQWRSPRSLSFRADGRAGAEALVDLANRYDLRRVDQLLCERIGRRGLATLPGRVLHARQAQSCVRVHSIVRRPFWLNAGCP